MTGPFRMGWSMDYPSAQNFLEPLYATDAGANFAAYSNTEFDALVAEGNAAATSDEAIGFYRQAEDVLLQDMPIIPLFFDVTQSVHSDDVTDVVIDAFGRVDTTALKAA
jgi:ABC-type oligopeptide transport system substrate-binding subunit